MRSIRASLVENNSLNEAIDKFRKDLFQYDRSLIADTDTKLNWDNFKNAPDGRFIIPYKNIDFDCLFKRNNESNRLYVLFFWKKTRKFAPGFCTMVIL